MKGNILCLIPWKRNFWIKFVFFLIYVEAMSINAEPQLSSFSVLQRKDSAKSGTTQLTESQTQDFTVPLHPEEFMAIDRLLRLELRHSLHTRAYHILVPHQG